VLGKIHEGTRLAAKCFRESAAKEFPTPSGINGTDPQRFPDVLLERPYLALVSDEKSGIKRRKVEL